MVPHQGVDEQHRLDDPDVVDAEGPQPDQSQILVPEGHGVAGAPFEVGENLEVGEIDFGPQRTGPAPRGWP